MAKFYEVQEFTVADGWINTWASPENWAYYTSESDAWADVEYHLGECEIAVKAGRMIDAPARDSFRVVEVPDSVALKGL